MSQVRGLSELSDVELLQISREERSRGADCNRMRKIQAESILLAREFGFGFHRQFADQQQALTEFERERHTAFISPCFGVDPMAEMTTEEVMAYG